MTNQPDNDAALAQAEELMRQGRLTDAEALCRDIISKTPDLGRAWVQLGLLRLLQGAANEAEVVLTHGVIVQPENAGAWNNLSAALFQLGRLEEAEQCA